MTMNKIAVHEKVFDINWGDMDALGHVNNARYFDYFQEARIDWLRTIKIGMDGKTGPVIIHAACTFFKPIIYPATLCLRSSLHSLGNSSMIMDHDLYQNEILMAQGNCKIVWIDYSKGKPVPIPAEFRNLLG